MAFLAFRASMKDLTHNARNINENKAVAERKITAGDVSPAKRSGRAVIVGNINNNDNTAAPCIMCFFKVSLAASRPRITKITPKKAGIKAVTLTISLMM